MRSGPELTVRQHGGKSAPAGPRGSVSASLEDCSAADLFAVVASIVLQDDAVSTGFCGVTCASSMRAVSLPTCSLLCVVDYK